MRIKANLTVTFRLYKKSNSPIILEYHGVAPSLPNPLNSRHIDPDTFENHLLFIKKNCNPVALNELSNSDNVEGKRKVALTFDDGYLNNMKYALPLLIKHNIPASIFITGLNETDQEILWSDYHDLVAQFGPKKFSLKGISYTHNGSSYKPFESDRGDNLHDLLKSREFDKKYEILNTIIPWNELKSSINHDDYWELLSNSQIKELAQIDLIEIGSHSYYHNNLSLITEEDAFKEIRRSKEYLNRLTTAPIQSIAYPDGSYTRSIVEFSETIGFKIQLAEQYNYEGDINDSRILDRVGLYAYETLSMQKVKILEK